MLREQVQHRHGGDGQNGSVWLVHTPTVRLFGRGPGRGSGVAKRLLADAQGALVCDGYVGYDWYARLIQRCWEQIWGHILREAHALKRRHPAHTALWAWPRP